MSRGLVLGLDGGGTRTRALTGAVDGAVLGEGHGGACNIAAVSLTEAVHSARTAAAAALAQAGGLPGQVGAVCAGVAGTSFAARRAEFHAELQRIFPHAIVSVEPDFVVALAGASGGEPGVIIIAGTGSVAYGENGDGKSHKAGAYGYLIDDAGSGYGVGRAALAAVLRAGDGTGEATTLTERVLGALRLSSVAGIVPGVYGGEVSRVTVASLARVVAESAREDEDAVARAILMRAGGALSQLVHGVTAALFTDAASPFPVAAVGGLWVAGPALGDVFARSVRRFAPQAIVGPPLSAPVQGALGRARCLLGGKALD